MLTDLHSHLLPAVDDGSRTFEEAARHLDRAYRDGVQEVVLTPHLSVAEHTDREIGELLDLHASTLGDLRDCCRNLGGVPALTLGQELLVRRVRDAERVLANPRLGLGGGPWLLVEFGFDGDHEARGVLETLIRRGRRVVVAHPERYAFARGVDPMDEIRAWRRTGAALQVNAGSLEGLYTRRARELAWRIVEEGAADAVASDHHGDSRPHTLLAGARSVAFRLDPEVALRLAGRTPAKILQRGHPDGLVPATDTPMPREKRDPVSPYDVLRGRPFPSRPESPWSP